MVLYVPSGVFNVTDVMIVPPGRATGLLWNFLKFFRVLGERRSNGRVSTDTRKVRTPRGRVAVNGGSS
jgi:hypothetical protein